MSKQRQKQRWSRSRGGIWFLEPTLLLLLHHGPTHGYTLIDQLEEFGLHVTNPSVVYRALRDIESKGWVTSSWDTETAQGPPRRVYELSGSGDKVLSQYIEDLKRSHKQIGELIEAYYQHMEEGEGDYH